MRDRDGDFKDAEPLRISAQGTKHYGGICLGVRRGLIKHILLRGRVSLDVCCDGKK
jgi:hypothetical protein